MTETERVSVMSVGANPRQLSPLVDRGRLQLQQEGCGGDQEAGGSAQKWGAEGESWRVVSAPTRARAFELKGLGSVRTHL